MNAPPSTPEAIDGGGDLLDEVPAEPSLEERAKAAADAFYAANPSPPTVDAAPPAPAPCHKWLVHCGGPNCYEPVGLGATDEARRKISAGSGELVICACGCEPCDEIAVGLGRCPTHGRAYVSTEARRVTDRFWPAAPCDEGADRVFLGERRWALVEAEAWAVLRSFPPASVDALLTDPPYSSGGLTRGDRAGDPSEKYRSSTAVGEAQPSFGGDTRDQRAYAAWLAMWLSDALRILRPGAPVGLWTDWRQIGATIDGLQAGGLVWRGVFVWTKSGASRPQLGRFRNDAEFFVWGSAGAMPMDRNVGALGGSIDCPPVRSEVRLHLTEKPRIVMDRIVEIVEPGGLVLDPFAGSATTGAAALARGLRFVGVERDPHYAKVARDRLAAEVAHSSARAKVDGQGALFGGDTC